MINHKNLKYFMTINKLNKRQARWVEFLIEFDFKITYQSEKKNEKADLFTKRSKDWSIDESNNQIKHMY